MNSRAQIINSFRSHLGERKKSIGNRLLYLRLMQVLGLFLILLSTATALNSLIPQTDPILSITWQDSPILILLSLSYLLSVPNLFYESLLLKHLKRIRSEENATPEKKHLNSHLHQTILCLNENNRIKILKIAGVGILLFVSVFHLLFRQENDFWEYFKIPYLLLVAFVATDFVITYSRLQKNIKEYEGRKSR